MKSRWFTVLLLACTFTLAAPVYFVVQTMLADVLGAASMTAVLAVAAFALVTLVTGLPRMDEIRALGRSDAMKIVVAGVLGVFASQYLVLANRYSDAPPGSEVIFFTTAAWGALAVMAAFFTRRKPSAAQLIAAGIALAGTAAVLANWERPSSFSPFTRYPTEHIAMLAGGVAWAVFSVLVADLGHRLRLRAILPPATAPAAVIAVLVALASPGRLELVSLRPELWLQLFVASCTLAAMLISWSWLAALNGVAAPASLLFLPAVSLTFLGIFERRVGAAGPSPLLWDAVAWGSAVTIVGALGVAMLGRRAIRAREAGLGVSGESRGLGRWLALASVGASSAACLSATVALWMPALSANVQGTRGGGAAYAASWTLPGAETPAGWIAFFAALLALAAAIGRGAWRPSAVLAASVGAGVAVASVPALLSTPLRTWTRWIPGEVQQDYGTEYARLVFERVHGLPATLALVLAGASVVLTITGLLAARHPSRIGGEDSRHQSAIRSDGTG